jgi:hypothetical protein
VLDVHGDAKATVTTSDEAAKLAEVLLAQGLETTGDQSARYALYDAARQVAEKAGNLELALRACDHIGQTYDVDVFAIKEGALAACIKMARPSADVRPLVEGALQVAETAIEADRFAPAERLAGMAMDLARRGRQRELLTRAAETSRQAKSLAAAYEPVRTANERLRMEPGHAGSHTIVGRFLCLLKGDWEQGLAHLAQGDDGELRPLAEKERALPTDAEQRLALADAWLAYSKKVKETELGPVKTRAAYWYRLAEPDLKGFDRARVEKTLQSLPAEKLAEGAAKTLLRYVPGQWKVSYDNGAVRTYRFDARGNALFLEEKLAGTLTRDGERLKLDFRDGKLERIRLDKDELLVEHFNPASGYPNSPPLAGRGTRVR